MPNRKYGIGVWRETHELTERVKGTLGISGAEAVHRAMLMLAALIDSTEEQCIQQSESDFSSRSDSL